MTAQLHPSGGLTGAQAVRALRLKRKVSLLELQRPWHFTGEDPERMQVHRSQRQAMVELLSDVDLVAGAVFGGNRSGKSTSALWLCIVWVLGRAHPIVKRWAKAWDLPLKCVPERPGSVVIGTQTHTDSIKADGVRQTIERFLKSLPHKWWGYNAANEARVEVYTTRGTGTITFKSFDVGREAWQGFKADLIVIDEEILRDDVKDLWTELLMRIGDKRGRIIYAMTGLSGYTWSYHQFVGNPQPGHRHWILRADDNPHIPTSFFKALYAGMTPEQISARRNGLFTPLTGLVFPGFRRAVIPHEEARPPEGLRVDHLTMHDFGFEHPSVCLWGWVDYRGPWPVVRVYRELRRTQRTPDQWARDVAWWSGQDVGQGENHGAVTGEGRPAEPLNLEIGMGDAASPGHRRALIEHGVQCHKAKKDIRTGTDMLRMAIAMGRVFFSDRLVNTITEFETMAYKPGEDVPPDGNDHGVDACRYGVRGLAGILDLFEAMGQPSEEGG